jgi:hypothetical protein
MKLHLVALSAMIGTAVVSCGGGGRSNPQTEQPSAKQLQAQPVQATASSNSSQQQSHTAARSTETPRETPKPRQAVRKPTADAPVPTKDAQWTIYCRTESGPGHADRVKAIKKQLMQDTKLKDWYIIHGESESTLYYGYYKSFNDSSGESKRAQADRKQIDSMTDANGKKPFKHSLFVELSSPDPISPPEWNLRNAEGYWSILIASYKDSPERKQYAIDAVRDARARGIEAYYLHEDVASNVYIGAWPMEAVKRQEASVDDNALADPNQDILIMPRAYGNQKPTVIDPKTGKRIKTLAPVIEPVDPTLQATWREYPYYSINGEFVMKKAGDRSGYTPTGLVIIPKPKQSLISGTGQPVNGSEFGESNFILPKPTPQPGTGRLKGIEE